MVTFTYSEWEIDVYDHCARLNTVHSSLDAPETAFMSLHEVH